MFKFMVWNCQGAASRAFLRALKDFVKTNKPDVIALLEPRIFGDQADKVCSSTRFDNWVRVEAVGFSGGIWVL